MRERSSCVDVRAMFLLCARRILTAAVIFLLCAAEVCATMVSFSFLLCVAQLQSLHQATVTNEKQIDVTDSCLVRD